MTLRIVLHPAAAREVTEARRYFDEVSTELGDASPIELNTGAYGPPAWGSR